LSARYRSGAARETLGYLAMSVPVWLSAVICFAVAKW
jgi:hypothetical protein